MPNIGNFILNSDYPMDKIVLLDERFMDSDTSQAEFAHGFNTAPLCFGVWSTEEDFSSPHAITGTQADVYGGTAEVYADETNVYLLNATFDTTTFRTLPIYVRTYAFLPESSQDEATFTSSLAERFIFNSDYNYLKLVKSLETTYNTRYYHGLGKTPIVLAWVDYAGNGKVVQPEETSVFLGGYDTYGLIITDQYVEYFADESMVRTYPNMKIYMRVYV